MKLSRIDKNFSHYGSNSDSATSKQNEIISLHPAEANQLITSRKRGRPRKYINFIKSDELYYVFYTHSHSPEKVIVYITAKEISDMKLSLQLRKEGIITTPGAPFEQTDKIEIEGLPGMGVFEFEIINSLIHGHYRIFNTRMVREIKDKETNCPYEKSRLVIQGHSDQDKEILLTQSPRIQRESQRVIAALSPSLKACNINLYLRDLTKHIYNQNQISNGLSTQIYQKR